MSDITISNDRENESAALAPLPYSGGDLIAFARSQEEMNQSQGQLIAWSSNKLAEARQHLSHMGANLAQAKEFRWALRGFQEATRVARKQVDFYEKLHAAFNAGYCVVPDFPIDVFAVRTARSEPPAQRYESSHPWGDTNRAQRGEALPLGAGDYVSDQPTVRDYKESIPDDKGQGQSKYVKWSEAFREIDFPIKTAAITVLDATGRAIALRIFDEIGILPARKGKGDPMVIGRVQYKHGNKERTVSFVIAWFLRESDLTV